jgi:hypothetical protein
LPGCSTEIDAFFDEYVHQSYATGSAKPDRVMQARLREREQALRRSLPRKTPLGAIEPI